ncbi:hypothetical protein D3C77_774960 [compost metagenome]
MVVDQLHRLSEILDPHAREYRTKDLLLVYAHGGGDIIEQRTAHPEAVAAAFASSLTIKTPAIDQ